jgi:hypothetical protein
MFASKTLRTLTLAAALMSPVVAGTAFAADSRIEAAHARGGYKGPTAFGAWTQADSRTPPAGNNAAQGNGGQSFLEQSGATGGGGQHS